MEGELKHSEISRLNLENGTMRQTIISMLLVKKLKAQGSQETWVQGRIVSEWESWDSNAHLLIIWSSEELIFRHQAQGLGTITLWGDVVCPQSRGCLARVTGAKGWGQEQKPRHQAPRHFLEDSEMQ